MGGAFLFLACKASLSGTPGYESDERSSLGLTCLALPVADAAKPFSVQRSVCNAATHRTVPCALNR